MQIEVNNQKLTFSKYIHREDEDSQILRAKLLYLDYELLFGFDEKLFSENGSIDWDIVKEFVKYIIEKIDSIQSIGIKAIKDFQKYVHIEEPIHLSVEGDFDADEINLVDFVRIIDKGENDMENIRYRFRYDVGFLFVTPHGLCRYPHYYNHYIAQFLNYDTLKIIGVYNSDIWNSYKKVKSST